MKLFAKIMAGVIGSICMFKIAKKIKDKRAEKNEMQSGADGEGHESTSTDIAK